MAEQISVHSVSDIITSKAGRQYFTLEDPEQKKYVCFIPQLKDYCKAGSEIEADLTPGKSESDSPRLDMIYVNGKPVIQLAAKAQGRSYGKSDKELAQTKQLAEAQSRSIQAQTALKRAVDLEIAGKLPYKEVVVNGEARNINIAQTTRIFYQLLQSLTQISEAEVIHREIKPGKVSTQQTGQLSGKEARTDKNGGGETLVKDAKTLMEWALSHGKQYHNSWVRKEANLGDAVITEAMAIKAYQEICTVQGWT